MPVFRLFIHTDNAAFASQTSDDPDEHDAALRLELHRLLTGVAGRVLAGEDISHFLTIFDVNGNDVGRFALKEEWE